MNDAFRASLAGQTLAEYRKSERARERAARAHRADVIAQLGLEPEGTSYEDRYTATTAEFEQDLRRKLGAA